MPRQVSVEELEKDIVRIVDEVIETRVPIEILVRGRRLLISPVEPRSKLERLEDHPDFVIGDPEDMVHMDWSAEWSPGL